MSDTCPKCGTDLSDEDPPESATDTENEIRHLVEKRGLSVAEVAEEVGFPEAVIEEWASRQSPEEEEQEDTASGADWSKLSE